MKKFIIKILIFLVGIFVIDSLFGQLCDKLTQTAIGGDTLKNYHISRKCNEDILVFGSSRSNHHYISNTITDSLGLSCYNCGIDGNGIILMYGLFSIITEYHSPKILIYDITTEYDLLKNDNSKYIGRLKPFRNRKNVYNIFEQVDKKENLKTYSYIYRYNSKLLQLISDNIYPLNTDYNGYRPHYETMNYEPERNNTKQSPYIEYDSLKIGYLEKLITECDNKIQLIFTTSPYYHINNNDIYAPIRKLCNKYNIPFLEHHNDTSFTMKREYFKDSSHLNNDGAIVFTDKIINELKKIVKKNQ